MKRIALILVPALLAVTLGAFALSVEPVLELGVQSAPSAGIGLPPCLEACADQLNFCISRCGIFDPQEECGECWEQYHVCQAACK